MAARMITAQIQPRMMGSSSMGRPNPAKFLSQAGRVSADGDTPARLSNLTSAGHAAPAGRGSAASDTSIIQSRNACKMGKRAFCSG